MALTDRDAREPAASDERHRPAVYAWAMGPSRRSPVAHLEAHERRQLLEDLNYLNLAEIRSFCTAHSIPRVIHIEAASGERRKTKETDRKSVVLERVRHYLKTGRVPDPTCFPAKVVWSGSARRGKLKPSDRLYYGTYDKHDPEMLRVLESLTDGRFRSGAVARILCREFWTDGQAPTFAQFAKAWLRANDGDLVADHPEAAYLTDRARGEAGPDWKAKRQRIARRVLKVLDSIPPP